MTEPPDPPPTIATMRTIGMVWVVVGVLALIGGAVATAAAVVVFGVLAILLGAGLIGIQQVRARSAIRASRTLTNAPAPPAAPPRNVPGPPRSASAGPTPGPPDDPAGGPSSTGDDTGTEAAVGSPSGSGSGGSGESDADGSGGGSAEAGGGSADAPAERGTSISEEEDGTGSAIDDDETPGARRD